MIVRTVELKHGVNGVRLEDYEWHSSGVSTFVYSVPNARGDGRREVPLNRAQELWFTPPHLRYVDPRYRDDE